MKRREFMKVLTAAAAPVVDANPEGPAIRIERAEVQNFEVPIQRAVKTAFGTMTGRHLVLLELADEHGNTGIGESWTNFPAWAAEERVAAFKTAFLPYLRGRQVAGIPVFTLNMAAAFRGPALQSGTMGPLVAALCAVEMALIELAAKRKKIPVCKLLFDNPARRVRVYASGINAPLPWEAIDSHLARGVSLFKLKLGFNDGDDLKNLRELKNYLGNRAKVAVDANRNWSFQQAVEWLPKLAGLDVQWLEEPLRAEEDQRTRELGSMSRVPIAGGENILVEPGSDITAFAGAPLAILQPDMTKYCTAHDFLRLLPEASKRGRRVIPHFLGSAPGQAFSLHLAAGCAGEPLVEWDFNANPLHTDFFAEPFRISDGAIEIPDRPGLGWPLIRGQATKSRN